MVIMGYWIPVQQTYLSSECGRVPKVEKPSRLEFVYFFLLLFSKFTGLITKTTAKVQNSLRDDLKQSSSRTSLFLIYHIYVYISQMLTQYTKHFLPQTHVYHMLYFIELLVLSLFLTLEPNNGACVLKPPSNNSLMTLRYQDSRNVQRFPPKQWLSEPSEVWSNRAQRVMNIDVVASNFFPDLSVVNKFLIIKCYFCTFLLFLRVSELLAFCNSSRPAFFESSANTSINGSFFSVELHFISVERQKSCTSDCYFEQQK